ncbi:hypothetical protein ACH50O_19575 [Methylomonas sp. 2BW1-5-20]
MTLSSSRALADARLAREANIEILEQLGLARRLSAKQEVKAL